MPLPAFSLARLLGLSALFLGLSLGCGGGGSNPPPTTPPAAPDASRSSVAVDRATGVRADGADRVTITVTVRDGSGKPLAGRTVFVEVPGDGTTVTQPAGATSASGVVTASVSSTQVGARQVTASVEAEGGSVVLGEQPTIGFISAPAVKLAFLSTSLSATAGEAVSPEVEVAVQDRLGRTVSGEAREVSLLLAAGPSSAGLEGTLTAQTVNGIARFPRVVLKQAGAGYQLKATSSGLTDATSPLFEVVPELPTSLVLALPGTVTAGSPVSATVTIRDSFGNLATNYRGTVHFSSTAPGATLPADVTFTAADNGSKSLSVTLSKAGTWVLQVEDVTTPTLSFTVAVTVQPAAAAQLVLGSLPGPFEVGEAFSVEVMVRDAFGNDATEYLGTIHFTSTDPLAELPEDYTFTAADDGRRSFNVVFRTAASPQQLTVTDTADPALTATLSREIIAVPPPFNPCADVTCEVPEPTCAADGVTYVTFSSACIVVDDLPTCQDTEARMSCPGAEGVCFAGACGTAAKPAAGELAITEVMHSPSAGTTEYVELHNPTQAPLNITGLEVDVVASGSVTRFTVSSPSSGGAVLIPPGGWFVIAQRGEFDINGGVPVDYALGASFDLPADGQLILRTASGMVVEDFTWSSSFPQTPGRAMNLAAPVVGTRASRGAWYWCDSSEDVRLLGGDYGTPGHPNEACGMSVGSAPAFCNIQYPKTFPDPIDPMMYPAVIPYGSRKTLYTQFSAPSLTDRNSSGNDDYPHVQVELGYGAGADPTGWQWSAARFNPFYDPTTPAFDPSKDEHWAWLRIFTPGTYSYGFRYRLYDPVARSFSGYTYCDQNGVAPEPSAGSYGTVTVGAEPLGPTDHIVISEFAPRGTDGVTVQENNEFLELYNPSSTPVDLSGWKLQYMPSSGSIFEDLVTVPQGTSIGAHGYYLIAHTGYSGSVTPDLQYSQALPHSGGNIRIGGGALGSNIVDSSVVDNLGWGLAYAPEGDAAPAPVNPASSLERKAGLMSTAAAMEGGADTTRGNGIDSDWNADDFVTRPVRDPQNSSSPVEAP
jgi:hypothetical protein